MAPRFEMRSFKEEERKRDESKKEKQNVCLHHFRVLPVPVSDLGLSPPQRQQHRGGRQDHLQPAHRPRHLRQDLQEVRLRAGRGKLQGVHLRRLRREQVRIMQGEKKL